MKIESVNSVIVISEFDELIHADSLVKVLKAFFDHNGLIIFGLSKSHFNFLNSEQSTKLYEFDVQQFLKDKVLCEKKGKLFQEDNISDNIEMLWLKVSDENDLATIINLNNLFTMITFEETEISSSYQQIIYHVETVDGYKLFIKPAQHVNFDDTFNILKKAIED